MKKLITLLTITLIIICAMPLAVLRLDVLRQSSRTWDIPQGDKVWYSDTIVSVADVFSKAIHGIHNDHSISSLFL